MTLFCRFALKIKAQMLKLSGAPFLDREENGAQMGGCKREEEKKMRML